MKKRTSLVCFLIFTLCVFYTSIPNTVFGQEASLAEQVLEKHSATFQRADIQAVLPQVLEALKAPEVQDLLSPAIINAAIQTPSLLEGRVPPEFITLLEEDQEIKDLLGDAQVQELLQDPAAIDELAALLPAEPEQPEQPGQPEQPVQSLAEQVLAKHSATFQRADIQAVLPQVLEALKAPEVQDLLSPAIINAAIQTPSLLEGRVPPEFITLLEEDQEIKDLLGDAQVQELLQDPAAIDELAALLPTEPEQPGDGTTPPGDGTTPPGDGTTPPGDGTTPLGDGTTPPGDGTTPPGDGTTPPGDGTTPPPDEGVVQPPVEVPIVPPAEPITPTNLTGSSRLGGLSLNRVNVRQIVEFAGESAAAAGYPLPPEAVASLLAGFVPKGFFPKDQIERTLLEDRFPILRDEPKGLDAENFGNAITPDLADFAYTDYFEKPTDKYLTRDGLHLYVRVPRKLGEGGGVNFHLTDTSGNVQTYAADEVTMDEFQADTIPYTFRLEETLAATHLPVWPDLENNQLFSSVTLRWHDEHDAPSYNAVPMAPTSGKNGGVVWEAEVGIPPDRGPTFYYFDVELAELLSFTTLDRDKIAELDPTTVTLDDVFAEDNIHQIEIDGWSMPDPRNLQLIDRGIMSQLLTPDLLEVFSEVDVSKVLEGDFLNLFTGRQLNKIQSILFRNTEVLTSQFEEDHDPMVASVFSVPRVDLEKHSLWVASIHNLDDDNYNLEAIVHDAEENALDQIQENFTVDTSAPEATIKINDEMASPGLNTTGYWNDDGVFVATAPEAGAAAVLSITADPTDSSQIGRAKGYLLYQIVGLNEDGTFYAGEASSKQPNTWMPLTVQSTMLTSTVWDAIRGAISGGRLELPSALESNPTLQLALGFDLEAILGLLSTDLVRNEVDNFIKSLEDFTGFDALNDTQYQLIVKALGATVDIIDHLVPVTFDASKPVMMPIQGERLPLLVGDYGIRALGIDTRLNVGAYAAPTHLRIVDPSISIDSASIMNANIGDVNNDGMVHPVYETGIIYANTEDVMITGAIENPTGHPIKSIEIQYLAPNGEWQALGDAVLTSASEFEFDWKVTDFDALIGAGDSVMVRAMATNKLQLTDAEPMAFSIELDGGIYPPEVLVLVVDEDSIMQTNPDSGAPQGVVNIKAYTLSQTGPETVKVRFELTQSDGTTVPLGTAEQGVMPTGLADAVQAAVGSAAAGTDASVNPGDYHEWTLTIDTTTLADTITKDGAGARDVSKDDNQHTIRAFAVSADATEWPSDAMTMLSVDNVDDVGPLGPTYITTIANAGGMVEADTHRGLVDENDPSVVPQSVTLTIEPDAVRKTYTSVMLVSDPEINAGLIGDITETSEGSGVFTVTVDIGGLGIEGNGTYKLHALVDDEPKNGQAGEESPARTVEVKNYERPDPAVFKLTVDDDTETKNADSGGPQGTFMFTGYTIEQNSPPIESIRLEAKRANDTDWTTIGTGDAGTSIDIEDAALTDTLDHLVGIAVAGTETGDKSVVAIDATNKQWAVSVDTVALKLEDTIKKGSDAARDASKDDNPYTVRAFAVDGSGKEWASDATVMFSLDNVDDVAPLAPTSISVTGVEPAEDGSYTVGGLVDKYDDAVASPVATFTIKPVAERHTYKSVKFTTDAEGALIGEITETAEGSGVFTVTVDVGTLADGETYLENGSYTFQALAYDEFDNVEADTDDSKASVTVANTYRPAPEVLAIAVDPESITQTNPDSGAPQGTITLHSYSHEISSPPTAAVRIEVKRPDDAEWIDVGTATDPMATTEVSDAALTDIVGYLANTAVSATEAAEDAEESVVPISQTYQMWMLDVDTTMIMPEADDKGDTITADSPAARDASKDDNQYMVRAVPIEEADDFADPEASPNATAMFSVDNVDDVAPLGPTNIIAVSDILADGTEANILENEDGSYSVGGIVDVTVQHPVAIFTIKPEADPKTYASVKLVTDAEGAVIGETIEIEEGVFKITVDVADVPNGDYMFHALAFDEFGNEQEDMSETDGSRKTVGVTNFRVADITDLAVIAVDGADVAEPPAEPILLRESLTVSFVVANGSLDLENLDHKLTGAINGKSVEESESVEDPKMTFTLTVMKLSDWEDNVYTPDGVVTQRNGFVPFPLAMINLDNTGPMVTIESPTEDETVNSLPTIRATYHDGPGAGVDGATGSLALARLQPPNEAEVVVDQADLEKDAGSLVYTRSEPLAGGAYRVTVQVTDNLGNVGEGSAEFAVNGTAPMVAIHSPVPGTTFEHGEPLISGEFSGTGTVEVTTFTINDVDATPEVDGNQFSYTPDEALANGDYKVVVAVTDGDGNMAQTSVVFMVDIPEPPEPPKDTTPPVISSVAPTGTIKDTDTDKLGSVVISAVVTDEQSAISSVKYSINGGVSRSVASLNIAEGKIQAPVDFETHGPGLYTVQLTATSQGGTTEHVWTFTLIVDNTAPTISSITPSGTFRGGLPVISASASDESGVAKIIIAVMDAEGKEVKGKTEDDGEDNVEGITRLDFNPEAPLDEGTYTIEVRATDTIGNSATAKENFTIDFDTAAPIITMASPHQNARFKLKPGEKAPKVSITYADAESGINVESITLVIEGAASQYKATPSGTKITLKPEQKTANQVMYPLSLDTAAKPETWAGEYVVRFEVTDNAHLEGNVSEKNKGAREVNRTVHTFSFFLEAAEGPIMAARPLNYPNPFKDKTRISFSLARQATVSIVIYDATLRPVRVLMDNELMNAGNHTHDHESGGSYAIGWDGTSSSGEDLARGIYFCEIIVADGFEPEYVWLKLALTR